MSTLPNADWHWHPPKIEIVPLVCRGLWSEMSWALYADLYSQWTLNAEFLTKLHIWLGLKEGYQKNAYLRAPTKRCAATSSLTCCITPFLPNAISWHDAKVFDHLVCLCQDTRAGLGWCASCRPWASSKSAKISQVGYSSLLFFASLLADC